MKYRPGPFSDELREDLKELLAKIKKIYEDASIIPGCNFIRFVDGNHHHINIFIHENGVDVSVTVAPYYLISNKMDNSQDTKTAEEMIQDFARNEVRIYNGNIYIAKDLYHLDPDTLPELVAELEDDVERFCEGIGITTTKVIQLQPCEELTGDRWKYN